MDDTENRLTQADLDHFSGSEGYYRHLGNVVLTDGAKFLAERAGAFWLMDVVASWQFEKQVACEPFQVWRLDVDLEKSKGVVVADDGNGKEIARQEIEFTDFPLPRAKLYLAEGAIGGKRYKVLMLPSEY